MSKRINNCYGLIGYPLSHSFSPGIFREIFERDNHTDSSYRLFPLESPESFPSFLSEHPEILGLNVTIPYKEKVIPYLDELDPAAREIGAVNTIRISRENGRLHTKGYNTDAEGFRQSASLEGFGSAIILGTGGSSRSVSYVLRNAGISYTLVSRTKTGPGLIRYNELSLADFKRPLVIINATPAGMFPDVESFPPIPYEELRPEDFLYDLVYNPEETEFLRRGRSRGLQAQNGMKMLRIQAEEAYKLWTSEGP